MITGHAAVTGNHYDLAHCDIPAYGGGGGHLNFLDDLFLAVANCDNIYSVIEMIEVVAAIHLVFVYNSV